MSVTVTQRITVDEFLARPERTDGWQEELIDGVVVLSPNAKKRHSHVSANAFELLLPLKRHGYRVLGEVACRLTSDSLPNTDAAVVDQKCWDAVLDDEFLQEAPALVVEVHSPANTKAKLLRKVELYLEHGAEQCWVIYPKERKVTIFFPGGTNEERREGDTLSFHGCDIGVKGLFA